MKRGCDCAAVVVRVLYFQIFGQIFSPVSFYSFLELIFSPAFDFTGQCALFVFLCFCCVYVCNVIGFFFVNLFCRCRCCFLSVK